MQLYGKYQNAVPLGIARGEVSGELISPEAQEVLDNMPVPLTGTERSAVIAFVNSQSSLGSNNWALIEFFAHGKLSDNTNKLWKWKANSAMINNGATLGAEGWGFNGTTQYIDSGFTPSTDGVNYKLSDAQIGLFVVVNNQVSGNGYMAGTVNVAVTSQSVLFSNFGTNLMGGAIQALNGNAGEASTGGAQDNTLYTTIRTNSSNSQLLRNGSQVGTITEGATPLCDRSMFVGGRNFAGLDSPVAFTASSFKTSAAIGFNHSNYYDNLVILNGAL